MKPVMIVRLVGVSAVVLSTAAIAAWAMQPEAPAVERSLVIAQAGALSLDQAVAKVRRMSGGKVISADQVEQDGGAMYRIKVVFPDGRVRIYYVEPATGDVQN